MGFVSAMVPPERQVRVLSGKLEPQGSPQRIVKNVRATTGTMSYSVGDSRSEEDFKKDL